MRNSESMADKFSRQQRSRCMSHVKGRDTQPERRVRSLLHHLGYRFRLHRGDLPGKPDIVLPRHRKIIFVHGCFWHQHPGCRRAARPDDNREFWDRKLDTTIARDARNVAALCDAGWKVLIVWQCEMHDQQALIDNLRNFLAS